MLQLENVNKTYTEHQALKDINVSFNPDETTVIVGPSGSGKSTLLRSLNLLERPETGLYTIDDKVIDFDQPIATDTKLWVRRQTGMVFQQPRMFDHLTILGNMIEAPVHVLKKDKAAAEAEAMKLLEHVGLADTADRYPYQLSGGQTQRIAIARALAMQPKYLLLDEPTSALDPEMEAHILRILKQMAQDNQSMILVTHNMKFAEMAADRILFLEDGAITFDGKPEEFFNHPTERIQRFLNAFEI
ncbi:amino acid ABC transporter ATP-binding protein [Weissella tructae]|jgi:cystine transport system ATP-binding protein|uniref:ABC transporter, ATP-binding protein n=2 Tax=Weissella TaxID=46255 RepID=A0A075U0Y5_9LACO|nr:MULTISPECIES: amino acid ABC transporter ATP-binding protein [Weissella]AIG66181.1 ABC transporter, ATP-binding protein [Weissella tructae]AIM63563.1 ABC transporter, ATP-binding protein [Weissella ceti]AIM64898.1 ABC transporter, ATP-binding protein [Weissella ceti]ELA07553.1 cystine ABC transporter ATP-binding protein [Weissella ceti NC36]QVV91330.1 amino acid ABC transporter ATP-binding protein [Weissella tructae]